MAKDYAHTRTKWKPIYDDLITVLLTGMTQREAAKTVGIEENTLSRLFRWPKFLKEYRRRCARRVEEAEAILQSAALMAVQVHFEAMQRTRPVVIEYVDVKGRTRKRLEDSDMRLALQAANRVLEFGQMRADKDMVANRIDALEQMAKKVQREGEAAE